MKVISMNDRKVDFVNAARTMLGEDRTTITRPEAMMVKEELGLAGVPSWLKKLKRAIYSVVDTFERHRSSTDGCAGRDGGFPRNTTMWDFHDSSTVVVASDSA